MPARSRERNVRLSGLLAESGYSAAALAREVNRLGAAQGLQLRYDRTSVAHWLAGSRPRPVVGKLVAEALSRRIGRYVDVAETGLCAEDPDFLRADERTGGALGTFISLAREDADPARRPSLTELVFRAQVSPHTGPVPVEPTAAGTQSPLHTGSPDTDRVECVVRHFLVNWFRYGGGHARTALTAYVGEDLGRLVRHPSSVVGPDPLLPVAARLAHLLGDMTADSGYQGLAQRYYLLALRVAGQAGDKSMRAITLRALSVQAARMGALRKAADLADAAVVLAGSEAPADLRAFVLVQRAFARSLLRDHRPARLDLIAAEALVTRPPDARASFACYPAAGFDYRAGQTLHRLGEVDAALRALRSAAAERPDGEHRTAGLSQARVALVLLERGHVEEACVHGRLFAAMYPTLRSHRATLALRSLQARLGPFRRSSAAAGLTAALADAAAATNPA